MTTVEVFAPAKVNLTLHVTGQRDDGYHLLDSLVAFASCGDELVFQPGNTLSLMVEGPEADGVPADMNNLAMKAAALAAKGQGVAMTLIKHLPAASGIGGGSADAAAAYRGMLCFGDPGTAGTHWAMSDVIEESQARALLEVGADIPMCLTSKPARVRGIGEKIEFAQLPPLPALLVNPRVSVATPHVFSALTSHNNAAMPDTLPGFADAGALIEWLQDQRNDLEAPAIRVAPVIADVLAALRATKGCQLARMSGSGATCFALFPDKDVAKDAGKALKKAHPNWWLAEGLLGDQSARALPRIS